MHIFVEERYTLNGFNVSEAGVYKDTLQTESSGCDSIITLVLNTYPHFKDTLNEQICQGDTFTNYGFNEMRNGQYVQYLQTVYGCDSIVVLNLKVNPLVTTHIDAAICEGYVYNDNGFHEQQAGEYFAIFQNENG